MAFVSNSSPCEDSQSSSGTDLNIINTEDEIHIDTTNWTPAKRKKLQHMTKFHEDYQWIFGEKGFYLYHNEKENFTYEPPYA